MSETNTDTIERLSRRVGVQDATLWTMQKTLEAHEWAEGGSCPVCARYKTDEHKPTCLISGLLGMVVSATADEDSVPTDSSSRRVDELERALFGFIIHHVECKPERSADCGLAKIAEAHTKETPAFTCPRCGGHRHIANLSGSVLCNTYSNGGLVCRWSGPYSEHVKSGEG